MRSLTGQEYEIDLAKDRKASTEDKSGDVTMQRDAGEADGTSNDADDAEDDGVTDPMQLTASPPSSVISLAVYE